jgi:dihydrolipoamide dehydrogenase
MADHVILATGSHPVELPFLPFSGSVISSTQALALQEVPETLVIVGAGYIGLELGTAFAKLGAKVTIVEARNQILPLYDTKLVEPVQRWLSRHGVVVYTGANALSHENSALKIETNQGQLLSLPAEKILVTVGRKPNTQGWGLDRMNLVMSGGFVQVDERCATSTRNVWAIGDLVSEPMLAHKAEHEGVICIEAIKGLHVHPMDKAKIPGCTYCHPQIASVGLTEAKAKAAGLEVKVGRFPFSGNGKAIALGEPEGLIKTVFDAKTGKLLGAHMVGAEVTELIQGFVVAMNLETTEEELMHTVFPHPTLSEMMHEAVLDAYGRVVHS